MRLSLLSLRLRRFRETSAGNVIMFFALGAPVLCLAVAIAIDWTNASIVRSRLNAAADAAALAALTPTMLGQPDSVAHDAAVAMFNARAAAIGALAVADTVVTVDISHLNNNMLMRNVTVTYDAATNTIFSQVLNLATISLHGTSSAQASTPPNINFYLLLDNSPSMLLPSTSAGITKMEGLTPLQDQYAGVNNTCAFACHQASTNNGDTAGNPCTALNGAETFAPTQTYSYTDNTGSYSVANALCPSTDAQGNPVTQLDNLALARANGITLRLDALSDGVTSLMQTAFNWRTSGQWSTPPTYQFTAYAMDQATAVGTSNVDLMDLTQNYQAAWNTAKASFGAMQMYSNNWFCADKTCTSGTQVQNQIPGVQDAATDYDIALSSMNATMPDPGNGSNTPGDKPQEILFFVTDGVEDEQPGAARLVGTINSSGSTDYCALIKSRGIKIAVLYTQYLAVTSNQYYNQNVAPIQNSIGPALQACASPGLFVQAGLDDNLGTDLQVLFKQAVQPATLSN